MKTQFGIADQADFEENTFTFKMNGAFSVRAGAYAIVYELNYFELLRVLKSMTLSMNVHPDYEEDSEFGDLVDSAHEIYEEVTGEDML